MRVGKWQKLKLLEVAADKRWALNGGPFGSKLSRKHYNDSGVPVIRGTNLSGDGRFSFDDFVWVSEEKADELLPNNAHPGDLIFTQRGTIGQVGLIPRDAPFRRFVISQSQMKLTPDAEQVDALFLYYYFSSSDTVQAITNLAFSAGVPHINLEILRNFKVPVPPLPIQRRVASILSTYDELIENSQRRIRILESMARTLYREWFIDFRFPGHESIPRIDSSLGEIPRSWGVKKLGDLISLDKGVSYNGAGLTEDGNPMVNLKNILGGGGFRRDATKPYSGDFKPRHTVNPGDIVLANTDLTQAGNIVASAALVPHLADDRSILISHHLFAVRTPEDLPTLFIYHLLLQDDFRGFAKGYAIGTTVLGLPKDGVLNFAFALPPFKLITDFVKQVTPMHQLIETLLDRIDNLRRTRDLLLPRLLSGQVAPEAEAA